MSGLQGALKPAPLKILILGGTGFIGPHQVEYALSRGHTVTLFNRGRTNPSLFPSVEKLVGDRNATNGYASLNGRKFDVVIDNPVQIPRWVNDAASVLRDNIGRYMYVSTLSAYATRRKIGINENDTDLLSEPSPPNAVPASFRAAGDTTTTVSQYGNLKVRGELNATKEFGERAIIVRPGLIVGPGDLTDRFSYWPIRVEQGGEVLAPGSIHDPVAYIDARDFSEFMIRLAEQGASGAYNCVGPTSTGISMGEMLYGMKAITSTNTRFTWVDASFVVMNRLRPYTDLPVWMPPTGNSEGWARMDCSKAIAAGLTFRTLADTARATLDYYHAQAPIRQEALRSGLKPEREREVLAAWHARTGANR